MEGGVGGESETQNLKDKQFLLPSQLLPLGPPSPPPALKYHFRASTAGMDEGQVQTKDTL